LHKTWESKNCCVAKSPDEAASSEFRLQNGFISVAPDAKKHPPQPVKMA
jgi:hypothetical protein